jgi:undecaprenyl-diphosphatase
LVLILVKMKFHPKRLLEFAAREPVLLTLVLLITGGVWAFVELAEAVSEGDSRAFDEEMILALRSGKDTADPLGPPWFEEVMRDVTALGGDVILSVITIAVVIYLKLRGQTRLAILLVTAVVGGLILSNLLKSIFDRPRPDLVPHGSHVMTQSFPSGHAMLAAVTYLTLGAIMAEAEQKRQLKAFFLGVGVTLTIGVGISRVYLGVHWPTDVLAGWCAGAAWALACWTIAHLIDRRSQKQISSQVGS